jgi:hypothetical protein
MCLWPTPLSPGFLAAFYQSFSVHAFPLPSNARHALHFLDTNITNSRI